MWFKKVKNIDYPQALQGFDWQGQDLKKYNIIYGWNGTGKTTLSRLFNFVERKSIHIPELTNIKFKIATTKSVIDEHGLASSGINVRVFNEDFISENLEFEQSKARKIIILGKENIETQKEIVTLEAEITLKKEKIDELTELQKKLPKLEQILTDAASDVAKQFASTPLASGEYYGRNYKRPKVDKLLSDSTVNEQNAESLVIQDQAKIDSLRQVINQEKERINLTVPNPPEFSKLFKTANDLLQSSTATHEIKTLENDATLRNWVEAGYEIHKDRKLSKCEFCGNTLPDGLLSNFAQYFTDELKKVKDAITSTLLDLASNQNKAEKVEVDSTVLFPEMVDNFVESKKVLDENVAVVNNAIDTMLASLTKKKNNLHDHSVTYDAIPYPKTALQLITKELANIKKIFELHNDKLEKISEVVDKAAKDLELHTVAHTLQGRDFFRYKKEDDEIKGKINTLSSQVHTIDQDIRAKKASIQNASEAIEKINEILKEYFGEAHIFLEATTGDKGEIGYIVKRGKNQAKMLSEGEKSILALVYFLIKLNEDGFDKSKGIVVVDDPVDSQDEVFLFRTFGLLKRQTKVSGQLVILTHNYNFFNLTRDWLCEKNMYADSSLLFIKCEKASGLQSIVVEDLPDLLSRYKSEYQYLFSRLYQYSEGTQSLDEPLVANIARKVLEYFSSFKWSCKSTEQFTSIVLSRFVADPNQLKKGTGDFIVKFLHEFSHGQDFSRSVAAPMLEAKPIAQNVLKFIELADKEHFDELKKIS